MNKRIISILIIAILAISMFAMFSVAKKDDNGQPADKGKPTDVGATDKGNNVDKDNGKDNKVDEDKSAKNAEKEKDKAIKKAEKEAKKAERKLEREEKRAEAKDKATEKFAGKNKRTEERKREKLEKKHGKEKSLAILKAKLAEKPNNLGLAQAVASHEKALNVEIESEEVITHIAIDDETGEVTEFYENKLTIIVPEGVENGKLSVTTVIDKSEVEDTKDMVLTESTDSVQVTVLEADPVIRYDFNNVEAGETVTTSTFSDTPIKTAETLAGITQEAVVEETTSAVEPAEEPATMTDGGISGSSIMMAIGAIVILGLGGIFMMRKKEE